MPTSDADNNFWDLPLARLLEYLGTNGSGLTTAEVSDRRRRYGPNEVVHERRLGALLQLLRFFANPLVLVLLAAAVVSFAVGERTNAAIIVTMVLLSVALDFSQVFQAKRAVEDLRQRVALEACVVRAGNESSVPVRELVPGDVVRLEAGSLVPADARLLTAKDLYVRESALTGESLPVDKQPADTEGTHGIADATNSVFFGTSVQNGVATAVVVRTGASTEFGAIAARLAEREPDTEFDRGIRTFGYMLIRVILLLVLFVFLVNVVLHRPLLESFLFALALAVGLTPEMLPVIVTITLARGARRMAAKKVIVKQLASIENFGSIEILCCDKTGTLTIGEVTLQKHVNVEGAEDERVLRSLYLNSFFETGMKSPLDAAVLAYRHPDIDAYSKVDEIPFDFERRRISVVVEREGKRTLVTKGAAEDVISICHSVDIGGTVVALDDSMRALAEKTYRALSADGYRVLGVATAPVAEKAAYDRPDETGLTLLGFAAFLDPPKEGAREVLSALRNDGISVLVMTGDNEFVTAKIARDVGLPADVIVTGPQMDKLDDAALAYKAEHGAIFARVSPEQKNRVITALKARGRVVGFMGDGINDAPSMHAADVGISVVNAVDVARDAANIILLEKDLAVLHAGVIEGRRSFANIMKYIIMGTSSNFGNMFSMAAASLFLPFLPMLPTQILLNNLLYDTSQISIPTDNVDVELLRRPKHWNIRFIRQFMLIIGPISSVYDFLTFGALLYVFHADQTLFHTGWFVESLATQTLVIFVIRTSGNPFTSRPSLRLSLTVLTVVAAGFLLPYTRLGAVLGMGPMPLLLVAVILLFAVTYLGLVQVVKTWFYRRHELI